MRNSSMLVAFFVLGIALQGSVGSLIPRKLLSGQGAECPSCPPPPPPPSHHHSSCFPGDAQIMLADGAMGVMADLKVGMKVATLGAEGRIVFSDIYAFGHTDPHTPSDFIRLSLAGGHQHNLELTAGHFIPTGEAGEAINKRAADVKVGDLVWTMGSNGTTVSPAVVQGVSATKNVGLFNPFTISGTIIVNGAVASVHSEWFLDSAFEALGLTHKLPATYQAILTPARLLYNALGREGYIWLYSALDSMFGAAGGIADVGNHFGGAIAATGAAGLSAGLVLAAKGAGSKPKLA